MAKYFDVLRRLLVLVYLVKTLFTLNVCCVIVQVTRNNLGDTFTYSTNKISCYETFDKSICKSWKAKACGNIVKNGSCKCICPRQSSTFLESDRSCVSNTKMRNKSTSDTLTYQLPDVYGVGAPLPVKLPSMFMLINFTIKKKFAEICNPNKVERSGKKMWIQIDKFILNKTVNIWTIPNSNDYNANLTLNWIKKRIPSIRGRVIRIRIKCQFRDNHTDDDFIIFKINGTVNNIPEGTSTLSSFISPTPSTVVGTTQVFSIVSTASASFQHSIRTTHLALYESTSFSLISPTIMSLSSAISSTPEKQSKDSSAKAVLTGGKISPTIMSSSSANSSTPENQSKDSSAKAVLAGAIIGTVLALVIAFLVIFYILRKKKQKQSGKLGSGFNNEMANKNWPSHILDNPLCQDGAYKSPENVDKYKKRKSGVNIDNANYDQCLVVENLSARNIPSVYDNVPEQRSEDEHAYDPLDPTKREPPSKYQSLIKPENEYSIISDDVGSTSLQEPIYYSDVDDKVPKNLNPKLDPVYNVLEANDSTMQAPSDPVYNVLEQSKEDEGKGEPVYNVLEQSGEVQGKQDPVYSELESK